MFKTLYYIFIYNLGILFILLTSIKLILSFSVTIAYAELSSVKGQINFCLALLFGILNLFILLIFIYLIELANENSKEFK